MSALRNVVFVGTRPLAADCLDHLVSACADSNTEIAGVLTKPRGSTGWWSHEGRPEVWQIAEKRGLRLLEEKDLLTLEYDALLCIYWGTIFSEAILSRARRYNVNMHTAPLPEYRGCHGFSHAILNGDTEYGTTLHFMSPKVDRGDIIEVRRFPILPTDTARSLYERTVTESFALFRSQLAAILGGTVHGEPQSEITKRTGRESRYYRDDSLQPFRTPPAEPLTPERADVIRRALTFPPRLMPPDYLTGTAGGG